MPAPFVFNLSDQSSIVANYLYQMRSTALQKDRMRFRRNMRRVGAMLGYELSKTLHYEKVPVTTPLADAAVPILKERIVLSPILRAGLALYDGLADVFDEADTAFIGSYRKGEQAGGNIEIAIDYLSVAPLAGSVLIMCDPMLASGTSVLQCLQALLSPNDIPKSIHIVSALATPEAIQRIASLGEKVHIWCAAIDPELNDKKYIVPGLGDAGDLSYGDKRI